MASLVQPPLTNREKNFIFVDTLPSPYYDILVGNAFSEMNSVRRIEDGIKRGKIMDNGANILEKKMIIFDGHIQAMTRERRSKRKSHLTQDELVKNFPHSLSYT